MTFYDLIPCKVSDEYRESVLVGLLEILAEHVPAEPDIGLPAGTEFAYTRLHVAADTRFFTESCLLVTVEGQNEVAISHNPDAVIGDHIDIDDDGLRAEVSAYLESTP